MLGYRLEERDNAPFTVALLGWGLRVGCSTDTVCRRWIQTARGQFPALTHHKVRLSSGVSVICKLGTITLPA